jgi:preprotein translocase subunit SecG
MILVLVTIVHVIVCLFLIGVVLLQSGASADLAGAFGGLGSQTAFGPRSGANLLTKLTTWAAIIFMLTSFTLAILSTRHGGGNGSVLDNTRSLPTQNTPAK